MLVTILPFKCGFLGYEKDVHLFVFQILITSFVFIFFDFIITVGFFILCYFYCYDAPGWTTEMTSSFYKDML